MALDIETGVFSKPTTGAPAVNVVPTTFQPKALIMWCARDATADGQFDTSAIYSYGFSDGTNHRSIGIRHEDAAPRGDSGRRIQNDFALSLLNPANANVGAGCTVAFNATDFTCTWNPNNGISSQIDWIIFGGADITGVQVGDFTKPASTTGNQDITTDADVQNITSGQGVLFLGYTQQTAFDTFENDSAFSVGFATKTTEEGCVWFGNDDNTGITEVRQAYSESETVLGYNPTSGAILTKGSFNGFDSVGFNIDWTTNDADADQVIFLIIKGGSWQVGNEVARTTVGTTATTTDFQPKGLHVGGVKVTTVQDATREDLGVSFGASDDTADGDVSNGVTDNDSSATTETGASATNDKTVVILDASATVPTINGEAGILTGGGGFNATNFTLDWTDAATSAFKFLWVVCGDAAVPPIIKVEPEVLDLVEGAVVVVTGVQIADEILDLPEGTIITRALIRLKSEILDLVEGAVVHRGRIFLKGEILDLSEGTVFTRALVRLKAEILDLSEGTVFTRTLVRLKTEILDLLEGSISVSTRIRIKGEVLELPEGSVVSRILIRLKAEVLDLIESALSLVPAALKIANEILDLAESAIAKVRAIFVKKGFKGIAFTRGTTAVSLTRGTKAIVLNRGTKARLVSEN